MDDGQAKLGFIAEEAINTLAWAIVPDLGDYRKREAVKKALTELVSHIITRKAETFNDNG